MMWIENEYNKCMKDNEEYNKEISFLEITNLAKKYLQLRDFDSNKIIEANLGD